MSYDTALEKDLYLDSVALRDAIRKVREARLTLYATAFEKGKRDAKVHPLPHPLPARAQDIREYAEWLAVCSGLDGMTDEIRECGLAYATGYLAVIGKVEE